MAARGKFTWETRTRREESGPPDGDGWEPFSSFSGQEYDVWFVYISWRRKVPSTKGIFGK